jgi:hypothetical protein
VASYAWSRVSLVSGSRAPLQAGSGNGRDYPGNQDDAERGDEADEGLMARNDAKQVTAAEVARKKVVGGL